MKTFTRLRPWVWMLVWGIIFSIQYAAAQNGQALRYEINVKSGTDPINHITVGDEGICLFFPTNVEQGKDSISWSFLMLDTQLKEKWKKSVAMHQDVTFLKGLSINKVIYLLFHDTKRNKEGNIFVCRIEPAKQLVAVQRGAIPDKAEVIDFEIEGADAYIGYNQRKAPPGLIKMSLLNGQILQFDLGPDNNAALLDLAIDTVFRHLIATCKIQSTSTKNRLYSKIFTESGNPISTIGYAQQQENRIIQSAQYIPLGDGNGLLVGIYGHSVSANNKRNDTYYNNYSYYNYYYPYSSYYNRSDNFYDNYDQTPVSDGYYAVGTAPGNDTLKYYSFSMFDNLYRYLNNANAIYIKSKNDRKKSKKGESAKELSLDLRVLTHDLYFNGKEFLLATESYSPEYRTVTRTSYDYYGRMMPTSYQEFEGYRYNNAFIASFDSAGNMKWNNGMELRSILTQSLNKKMNLLVDGEETVLFYNANNKLAFKSLKDGAIAENTIYTELAHLLPADEVLQEYKGSVEYWYGSFFVASGYEVVRNSLQATSKRCVFYLNKLSYE